MDENFVRTSKLVVEIVFYNIELCPNAITIFSYRSPKMFRIIVFRTKIFHLDVTLLIVRQI